ncbi:complex I subunit 1 family protein [Hymenobacter nivis]|uniref:NADH-quinone oxidoreductase subunit H n=1 Tax=Hymenobacter nivis TaxID=1850093 RepID=A0A2Z3GFC1_9BACT|nr:complex I subunit 1 family protein [Hymenobacter nivis]AWM32253.1 NADH-quinone oxidoreductase subunit H [Hymenobacter nivis]
MENNNTLPTTLLVGLLFAGGVYALAVLEYWSVAGRLAWARPVRLALKLLAREEIKPRQRDAVFYETAPVLLLAAGTLAAAVLPWSASTPLLSLATGALFVNAAFAYAMVALVLGGWSSNGAYAMIGGWRFLGQLLAYSMPMVMALTATVMRAESMVPVQIVLSQRGLWNIVYQPVGFGLFYLAALALAFLPPFDLPVAAGELAGGAWADFTGARRLVLRLGRLSLVMSLAVTITVFYLGGWQGPGLPGVVWTLLKTLLVAASFFGVGHYVSRVRYDLLLEWSWKYATPAALLNILWVGILLLL